MNLKDKDGWTAMMLAAHGGHTETVEALINAGADVNAETPRGGAARRFAASKGFIEIVEMLKKAGSKE